MFKYKSIAPLLLLTVALLFSWASYSFAEKKPSVAIATVNVGLIMKKSPQTTMATQALKSRFQVLEKKLEKEALSIAQLKKDFHLAESTLDKKEKISREREFRDRQRVYNRGIEDYRESLRIAREEALEAVQTTIFQAIESVREAQNIDIIIQDYVAASKEVDITNEVLDFLVDQAKAAKEFEVKPN